MRAALVALLVATAAAVVACGGEESGDPAPVGEVRAGSVRLLADCGDWKRGSVEERMATVREIRPGGTSGSESPLSDEEVYEFFERNCSRDYAETFRLYKLYSGAAPYLGQEP